MTAKQFLTMGDLCKHFGLPPYHMRRILDRMPEGLVIRVGPYRAIPANRLADLEFKLKELGYECRAVQV